VQQASLVHQVHQGRVPQESQARLAQQASLVHQVQEQLALESQAQQELPAQQG
jgi:hypothetical protein